ncbi:MAG: SpaH/EbpB family LPXTG-anchored major pilin [Andreesenia angusta]|nr:SpaH/EbpB family LPXTG-anchored major pilin [Andreesenia angusta]
MKKKIIGLLTSALMIMAMILPVMAFADVGANTTNVIIHKMLLTKEALNNHDVNKKYDPSVGIDEANYKTFFGDNNAKQIPDVYFVALKAGALLDDYKIENGQVVPKSEGDIPPQGKTLANGLTLNLEDGDWVIYEIKELSTYKDGDKILAENKAVPVEITLPLIGSSGRMEDVHVYPKNTEDGPEVDKDVTTVGNKHDTFDFDEEHKWIISAKIPEGINDYKVFKLTDVLQNSLTYKGKVKVSVVDTKDATTGVDLVKDTDYILTEPAIDTEGGTLTVDFSSKIANLVGKEGKYIRVEFYTTINENAIMGQSIPNDVDLEYGHDPGNTSHKEPGEKPEVHTGGKKFIKNEENSETTLSGAEFIVSDGNGNYLTETNGVRAWKSFADKDAAKADPNIFKLISGADGTFEIKGLKYADDITGTKYYLEEIKAPDGYALLDGAIEFTVNKTSYYTNPDQIGEEDDSGAIIEGEPAEAQIINNIKVNIPQTGGMGTIIFTIAGLAIMTVAFLALRKRNNEQ